MSKLTIGNTLHNLRIANSYTVDSFIALLNDRFDIKVGASTVYSWESGRTLPNLEIFLSICQLYDINVEPFSSKVSSNNDNKSLFIGEFYSLPIEEQNSIIRLVHRLSLK